MLIATQQASRSFKVRSCKVAKSWQQTFGALPPAVRPTKHVSFSKGPSGKRGKPQESPWIESGYQIFHVMYSYMKYEFKSLHANKTMIGCFCFQVHIAEGEKSIQPNNVAVWDRVLASNPGPGFGWKQTSTLRPYADSKIRLSLKSLCPWWHQCASGETGESFHPHARNRG